MKVILLLLALLGICFGLFFPFPFRLAPLPVRVLFDSFHLPLFFTVTLALRVFFPLVKQYLLIPLILSLALSTEILQPFVGRSAELQDFIYDTVGTILGAMVPLQAVAGKSRFLGYVVAVAAVSMVVTVSPPTYSYYHFVKNFPILSDFSEGAYGNLWTFGEGSKNMMHCKQSAAVLTCNASDDLYSTMQLSPGRMNWSDYNSLQIHIENQTEEFTLHIRIDDSLYCKERSCRWVSSFPVPKGRQTITVDITKLSNLGAPVPLNLNSIIRIILFTEKQEVQPVFALERIELSG